MYKGFFLHQCAESWYGELALGILSRMLCGFTEKIFWNIRMYGSVCDYFMKDNLLIGLKLTVPTDGMKAINRGKNYFV